MAQFQDNHAPDNHGPAKLPAIAGLTAQAEPRANVAPSPAFYLAHHARRWQVMSGMVVPSLRKISFRPGANGVDVSRNGIPDPSVAVSQAERKGWTVIPWDVDGEGTAYLYEVQGGWLSKWESLYPGAIKPEADELGYATWCLSLVDRGVVPQPRLSVLAQLADELNEALIRVTGKHPGRVPIYATKLEAVRAKIDAVQEAHRISGAAMKGHGGLPVTEAADAELVKPKRTRRTKAQMEAARLEREQSAPEPVEDLE